MKRQKQIAWICLIIAGLLELVWAYFVKLSHGFTILIPAVIAVIVLVISFFLLERGIREFGIGMSYGVFTGIGVAGTAIVGIVALGESISLMKIISLAVLMCGIIGLKLCEGNEPESDAENNEPADKENNSEPSVTAGNGREEAES